MPKELITKTTPDKIAITSKTSNNVNPFIILRGQDSAIFLPTAANHDLG